MATPRARAKVPKKATAGEVITIKTLISHIMESGQRKDDNGNVIPRSIINKFICEFNGKVIFSSDMEPAVAENPYFEFNARADESGTFKFTWVDDDGSEYTLEEAIAVN